MKSFLELYKYNFGKEVRKKPTFYKDKDGKMQKTTEDKWLDYVEWATVLVALYNIGEAKSVAYSSELHPTKKNTLEIKVVIDGAEFFSHYPIIDGNTVITEPNQMQTHRAEQRGFVKCVAINTGLGLSLWQKEESHMNELPPTGHKKEKTEVTDNTIEFIQWVEAIERCKTTADLGALYDTNKDLVNQTPNIKALFIKRQTELKKK